MFELQGKYSNAKVFTDNIENEAISQIINMCNQSFTEGATIRIMPDVHAGAGCTIGTTMTITDKVVPNLVGVDIGCGMETTVISDKAVDFEKLDNLINAEIPSGFDIRQDLHKYAVEFEEELRELRCLSRVNIDRALLSIGSLGGGNHFIEMDKDAIGRLYLVIHSGSRHLGAQVAKFYQEEAFKRLQSNQGEVDKIITEYKKAGRQSEIQSAIAELREKKPIVPKELAYCEGELYNDYLHDMGITQKFAMFNRQAMTDVIIRGMGLSVQEQFTTIHNYIDLDVMILRKGSVSAKEGEKLIIPINMRDGSLICKGKGNADWNFSAPHGAGRLMSRSKAKETLTMEEFTQEMAGIYSTSINTSTLDESPMAYKPMDEIVENVKDTVDIIDIIKPIYNFKASN